MAENAPPTICSPFRVYSSRCGGISMDGRCPNTSEAFLFQLVENLFAPITLHLTLFPCRGAILPDHHLHFRNLDDHRTCSFCIAQRSFAVRHRKLFANNPETALSIDQATAAMASRLLVPRLSAASRAPITSFASRSFQTSSRRFAEPIAVPVKRPVGAFRGG